MYFLSVSRLLCLQACKSWKKTWYDRSPFATLQMRVSWTDRTTQSTKVHFRPSGLSSVFTVVEAIFNRVSICDHCCATMPNVSGRVWNKKCKCLQKILLHITPQAIVWQNSQWWENAYLYGSMPNNITCHFKLLISYGIMLCISLSLSTYRICTCVDDSEEEAQLVGHLAYGNSTISQT